MRVFLTGATGFIGQPLTRALRRRGWRVTALVRRPDATTARTVQSFGVHLAQGDATDPESVRAAMRGADVVVHNAGHYEYGVSGEAKARMTSINVRGTEVVLDAARALGIGRIVHVSSIMALGGTAGHGIVDESFVRQRPPVSHYEQTKTEAHAIAVRHQAAGAPVVIVCPGAVVGANDHAFFGYLLRLYLARRLPPIGWGRRRLISCVHVEDVAEGIALAAGRGAPGRTYLLAGNVDTVEAHLSHWWSAPGAMRIGLYLPWPVAWLNNWSLEPLQRAMGLPTFLSRDIVMTVRADLAFSSARAQQDLGWQYRDVAAMWRDTIRGERELLRQHPRRTLVEKLRPVDPAALAALAETR
ncbi:NAD-dependent dehydratase [Luteitalea sp. TBR-22]|uniref:SDR family NAD(P)-dependent oxidoreductase n=1 Tax=Luteitalea sp. TBR-22 TaxID=2802971 RepID=UPI001AF798A9|nr:SDR family NAD(P)-dependent oxidoreductase [Luteitalea sp. TBR-22]BCS35417.1 NAD-dependent dehydratase [Luteitalea sp. TBR-22]